jgi:protein O-GlcNAc transferase
VLHEALLLHQKGQLAEAAARYRSILAQNPRHPDALHLLGVVELQEGRAANAVTLISDAIGLEPTKAAYHTNLGLAFHRLHRFGEALACLQRALSLTPNDAHALNTRGNILRELRRPDEALASYTRALDCRPEDPEILNNRGAALKDLRRLEAALDNFNRALAHKADYAAALNNRGIVLADLGRHEEAIASYREAVRVEPGDAEALNNWGNALSAQKRFEDAIALYDRALAIKSDYADAYYNRGCTLCDLRRFAEAVASFDRAIAIERSYAFAFNGRGVALAGLKQLENALADYDRAIALHPDYVEAHYNRANALSGLNRLKEGLAAYDRAFGLRPDYPLLRGFRLLCKLKMCLWKNIDEEIGDAAQAIERGEDAASPSVVLATSLDSAVQRRCAEIFVRKHYPESLTSTHGDWPKHERIRIGYFSSDFHDHATAYLTAELFEQHDRSRFEIAAFSFGGSKAGPMRLRIERAVERFIDVTNLSDAGIASLSRQLEIDIAVDLKGFTQDSRPGIFAMRSAPVQVNYLGYAGTMGAPYMDYLIADRTVIPENRRKDYAETIFYLPNSYQPNDSKREIGADLRRADCGLTQHGFVFCCFNASYKITPGMFQIWMNLLRSVEGSCLWLYADNRYASENLKSAARVCGIDPCRLVFARRCEHSEHLARYGLADLFLDTLPYNAHTTASDALWAGVPVITCLGDTFPGRVAASVLSAAGMPELVCDNLSDYEALAFRLASHPDELSELRSKLARNRGATPLFDTARFVKDIESAYTAMAGRPCR